MDDNPTNPSGQYRLFLSYAGDQHISRKAAFEQSVLRLLSQPAEDYAGEMNVTRVMAALRAPDACQPRRSEDEQRNVDAGVVDIVEDAASGGDQLPARVCAAPKSVGCAPASTQHASCLRGAHNAEALAVGQDLVTFAAKRPSRGIWQLVSGKGGSGKTTLLVHLACMAAHRRNLRVRYVDLGATDGSADPAKNTVTGMAGADLIFIDNADRPAHASNQAQWWAEFDSQVSKSACVVVAVTPDALSSGSRWWPERINRLRDTELGLFDHAFRRALIGDLIGRPRHRHGDRSLSIAALDRLSEELWGNGWQLDEGIRACLSVASVLQREPKPEEIDAITVNIAASRHRDRPPLGAIRDAVEPACDAALRTLSTDQAVFRGQQTRDLALYLTKAISGQALEAVGRHFALPRRAAMQAIRSTDRQLSADNAFRQLTKELLDGAHRAIERTM